VLGLACRPPVVLTLLGYFRRRLKRSARGARAFQSTGAEAAFEQAVFPSLARRSDLGGPGSHDGGVLASPQVACPAKSLR